MAKAKLVTPDKMTIIDGMLPGERAHGAVVTRIGIGSGFPLHAGFREMQAGSTLEWFDVASGLIVHLWDGAARIGDIRLDKGSAVVIEHGATARIDAIEDDTVLLVFDAADDRPPADAAGGHVHVLPADRVQREDGHHRENKVGAAIYADSACPTCRLWLHENTYFQPHFELGLHSHSQDEIIVVTAGEMIIGNRSYRRGAMLAVARDVLYGFEVGDEGMQFINFRPSHPTFTSADKSRFIDEAEMYRERFPDPPPYIDLAQPAVG